MAGFWKGEGGSVGLPIASMQPRPFERFGKWSVGFSLSPEIELVDHGAIHC